MGFVSMIFVYGIFICAMFGLLFIVGLIFLIIGIVNKRKTKYIGRKSPIVCIITGSAFLVLPVVVTVVLIIGGISSAVSKDIKRTDYDCIIDRWRNERVSDNQAADEAIQELLGAADAGDREKFAKTFTPNLQESDNFESLVNAFFDSYPIGLSQCELGGGNVSSSGSYDDGDVEKIGITSYTCVLDDEWYYIQMSFCNESTTSPNDVGVTSFYIENLEAYALDSEDSDNQDSGNEYLVCKLKKENEVKARLIRGTGFVFEPTPERIITETQMRKYLEKYDNLYDLSLEIGNPNVTKKYSFCTGYDNYYELAPEDGEPRYAYICTSSSDGSFLYGYICSDKECLYDRPLFPEE